MRIELRCNVRIESNRKMPLTNRLSLAVLDMDGAIDEGRRQCEIRKNVLRVSQRLENVCNEKKCCICRPIFLIAITN